jgi:endonuclease/exonuclease/phosphatase family metal-dependent hydrolase
MSYNVRCANDTLRNNIDGSIKTRSKYVINNILLYKPDSVGFQEVTISKNPKTTTWFTLLRDGLKDYYIGVGQGRDDKNKTEGNPIFYNKIKFDLIEQGTKWLSPTPDVQFTEFEQPNDGYKRILTYVILKNKKTGNIHMHINTHLDYKVKQNRLKQIEVIKNFVSKYKDMYPIVLTGDFNSTKAKGDAVMALLNQGFCDSSDEATDCFRFWTFPSIAYSNVYQNCTKRKAHKNGRKLEEQDCCGEECDKEHGKVIDYCLRCNDKLRFEKYKVVTDYQACGGISSDHYPIYIEGYLNN